MKEYDIIDIFKSNKDLLDEILCDVGLEEISPIE